MTSIDSIYASGGDHLRAEDLKGRMFNLTIEDFDVVEFPANDNGKAETKVVLSFNGAAKTLVVNKTNAESIANVYGKELEDWPGKPVTLFATQTSFGGKMVPCIRVTIPQQPPQDAPQAAAPTPPPAPEQPMLDQSTSQVGYDDDVPF